MSEVLDPLDARLVDLGHRILRLLAHDAREFFVHTVRDRFTATPEVADGLDAAALAQLKRDTLDQAAAAAASLEGRLRPESAWLTAAPAADFRAPLTQHPPIAQAVEQLEADVHAFLTARGLPPEPPVQYRLPERFIDGENLVTLTMNFWKAVQRRANERARTEETRSTTAAEARRMRWDEA